MSGLQATLHLYEREVGPMPDKVKSCQKTSFLTGRGSELYSLFLQHWGAVTGQSLLTQQ